MSGIKGVIKYFTVVDSIIFFHYFFTDYLLEML